MLKDALAEGGEGSATAARPPIGAPSGWWPMYLSHWRLVAVLQVAEGVAVILWAHVWLNDSLAAGESIRNSGNQLSLSIALALVVHFILRSLGAYDLAVILKLWRSSTLAVLAWSIST